MSIKNGNPLIHHQPICASTLVTVQMNTMIKATM